MLERVKAVTENGLLVEGSASVQVSKSGSGVPTEFTIQPRDGVMRKYPELYYQDRFESKDIFK